MSNNDFFNKEKRLLNAISEEKKDYLKEIFNQKVLPIDILEKIKGTNEFINTSIMTLMSSDMIDFIFINKTINQLLLYKVYFNSLVGSLNFLKGKLDVVKINTKLKGKKNSFDDGEFETATHINNMSQLETEHIMGYYNLLLDILNSIKQTKDSIDTTIIALQSQLKNTSQEYINAGKISS